MDGREVTPVFDCLCTHMRADLGNCSSLPSILQSAGSDANFFRIDPLRQPTPQRMQSNLKRRQFSGVPSGVWCVRRPASVCRNACICKRFRDRRQLDFTFGKSSEGSKPANLPVFSPDGLPCSRLASLTATMPRWLSSRCRPTPRPALTYFLCQGLALISMQTADRRPAWPPRLRFICGFGGFGTPRRAVGENGQWNRPDGAASAD